ncbi:GNAT family N-acetyltransferase [Tepidibacter aestuarii]|uniref:GNAT family N-acetyltransferase n=1 Tax=Tepidibacter aestuarii TaxID=2925782 RepID=UPI0020BEAAEB|nr:GNAT family N-acetyltransferase [Tepidibacter aestuarii]CAH2212486.1 [ribosomal protein S5]-alanine N-acetyltransferase [Tepidibacter aestuarii]
MMVEFETDRLILRTLKVEDLEYAMDFWGNSEVMRYCGKSGNRQRLTEVIDFYISLQNEKRFSPYAVILKENRKIIGACGFNPTGNDCEIELIYHFAKEYWGKGYATEAAQSCVDYAYNNLKINKIIASIDPRNKNSKKILEKLGFEYKYIKWCEETKQEDQYFELSRL